jgi:hypothetical protein
MVSEKESSAVGVAAKRILAKEKGLSVDQLAKKIVDLETSLHSEVRALRISVVSNILRKIRRNRLHSAKGRYYLRI